MQGGSIIRLFHRELECYVVAEGSFANADDDKVVVEQGGHPIFICSIMNLSVTYVHSDRRIFY